MTPRLRAAVGWTAALLLFFGIAVVRVAGDARDALTEGRAALARGDGDRGVRALRRAAHLYLPGNAVNTDACDALERYAREEEALGHQARAVEAWRAIRSSALATRWLVVPYRAHLDRANRSLARLMALLPPPAEERDVSVARREELHYALLLEDRAPDPAWVLVLGVGVALWLGGAFYAARHGWDDDDRPRARTLAATATAVTVGLVLFVLALRRA